jgi:hypothetical protein
VNSLGIAVPQFLQSFFNFCWANKEWLFSGAAIPIIAAVSGMLFHNNNASPTNIQTQDRSSRSIQSGRDTIINNDPDITLETTKALRDALSIIKGGMAHSKNIDVNIISFMSSAGIGSSTYQSFIRILNVGAQSGAVTVQVWDGVGKDLGSWAIDLAPRASIQLSASAIEEQLGINEPQGTYSIHAAASFPGIVEHLVYDNSTNKIQTLFIKSSAD